MFRHLHEAGTGAQDLRIKYQFLNTRMYEVYGVCLGQWPQIAFYVYYGYFYDEALQPKAFRWLTLEFGGLICCVTLVSLQLPPFQKK